MKRLLIVLLTALPADVLTAPDTCLNRAYGMDRIAVADHA